MTPIISWLAQCCSVFSASNLPPKPRSVNLDQRDRVQLQLTTISGGLMLSMKAFYTPKVAVNAHWFASPPVRCVHRATA